MQLSVIIPTYNRAGSIARAIDSVLVQSLPSDIDHIEVIVVDDGSTDDTCTMLANLGKQVSLIQQDNRGVSAARNTGLKAASGEWIAFLDSDDQWLPNKLLRQFSLLKSNGLQVCHTEEIWIRNGVRVNQMLKHRKSGGRIFSQCVPLCAMSPSSIVIHRSIFTDVGYFNEALPACEDYDLWLKISAMHEVAFVEQPCINKFGGHEDQLSRQHWGMDRFRVIALESILSTHFVDYLSHAEAELATTTLLDKISILLAGARKRSNLELEKEMSSKLRHWETVAKNNGFETA